MSELLAPQVYRVTVTDLDGTRHSEIHGWTASHANHMINRMIRLADEEIERGREPGYEVIPATGASGALTLRRRHRSFVDGTSEVREQWRTWELEPLRRPALSAAAHEDLRLLSEATHPPRDRFDRPDVAGGVLRSVRYGGKEQWRVSVGNLESLAPARWRRLVEAGWAAVLTDRVEDLTPVRVTVAGRVALALAVHRTRTSSPEGYHYASQSPDAETARSGRIGPWRKGGRIFDGSSFAVCEAGCLRGRCLDRREMAQAETRAHRAEMVLTFLGASKEQAERAGRRARAGRAAKPYEVPVWQRDSCGVPQH